MLPQAAGYAAYHLGQVLVVLAIGMVGANVSDHVIGGVYCELGRVVELAGFARFNADPRIGIRGAVMRLVAGVLAVLVARPRPLVLVLAPFLVAALQRLQLLVIGRYSALAFVRLIPLGLADGGLFIPRT